MTEEPGLTEGVAPGHQFRCWHPVGSPAADAALEANMASGRVTETGVVIASAGGA